MRKHSRRCRQDAWFQHGPVISVYSKNGHPQIEPTNKKGELAAKFRSNPPKSEQLMILELKEQRPDLPFWHQHVILGYIVDFLFPTYGLILEIDGPCHKENARKRNDYMRDRHLKSTGYEILHVPAALTYTKQGRSEIIARMDDFVKTFVPKAFNNLQGNFDLNPLL